MYLSRLVLNPKNKFVKRDLADCHEAHRTMMSAFPDLNGITGQARKDFGLLYRIESDRRTGIITVLIQSLENPQWSRLPEGYLATGTGVENPAVKAIDEQYRGIENDNILSFRLRANPTKKIGTTTKKEVTDGKIKSNGKRTPINDEAGQIEWLKRKAQDNGFEIITVVALPGIYDVMMIREDEVKGHLSNGIKNLQNGDGCRLLTFSSIIFEGRIRVTDREKFVMALRNGIGSGKAYGFGLISVAKPR